jgi:hypothetical protein
MSNARAIREQLDREAVREWQERQAISDKLVRMGQTWDERVTVERRLDLHVTAFAEACGASSD